MTTHHAVIIGAGVAGLTAAWWLERAGWRTHVVERADSLREAGYMLGLSGPGYATTERMGLLPALEAVSYRINENVYRDRRGRELLRLRYRDFLQDLPYLAVRRNDLVTTLHDALPPGVDMRLGTAVAAMDEIGDKVDVTLSDGASVRADLVIGADGFRSATRDRLFGSGDSHLVPLGYRFAVYDIDDVLGLEADFLSYAEPGHLAEYYALKGGRLAAMHVWRDKQVTQVPPLDRWALLERVSTRSHPMVRTMMEKAKAGPLPVIDSLTLVDLPHWSRGRVMLLGDAAHCLTLVSGQGAGMAMASAEILAQELQRLPVIEALAAHEKRLRPVISRLQQRSRRMASMFIPEKPLAFHLRNFILRRTPRAWLGRYFVNAIKSEIALMQ